MTEPAMRLGCLLDPEAPTATLRAWAELVAPEVAMCAMPSTGLAGPWAMLGTGALGQAAFDLAASLSATGNGPARLVLCDCPPPAGELPPLDCPIIALAGTAMADDMAEWRTVSTAGFTLRLMDQHTLPPHGAANTEVALALKEELQVWPY
jgi:surfactin synthase thioesterase subunit